jgi:hypothetical protein
LVIIEKIGGVCVIKLFFKKRKEGGIYVKEKGSMFKCGVVLSGGY